MLELSNVQVYVTLSFIVMADRYGWLLSNAALKSKCTINESVLSVLVSMCCTCTVFFISFKVFLYIISIFIC